MPRRYNNVLEASQCSALTIRTDEKRNGSCKIQTDAHYSTRRAEATATEHSAWVSLSGSCGHKIHVSGKGPATHVSQLYPGHVQREPEKREYVGRQTDAINNSHIASAPHTPPYDSGRINIPSDSRGPSTTLHSLCSLPFLT